MFCYVMFCYVMLCYVCMYVPYIPCISGFYHEIIYIFLPTEIVTRMRIQLYDVQETMDPEIS